LYAYKKYTQDCTMRYIR